MTCFSSTLRISTSVSAVIGFVFTLFSTLWVIIIGAGVMLAIILELISNHEVKLIIGLSYLCLLPAIAQLAIASILEEGDALFFCSAEDYKVKGDDPICDVRVYQALNVLGFAFWVITAMLLRRELEVVTKMEEEPDSDEPAKDKDLERDAREVEEMEAL